MSNLFVILCLFIGFLLIAYSISSHLKKTTYKDKSKWENYMLREHKAHFVTKKEFPSHLVLTCEKDSIPTTHSPQCQKVYDEVLAFHTQPMVHLADYTNLQLKEAFGINHFHTLVGYEETFIRYVVTLKRYIKHLRQYGYEVEADSLLTYLKEKKWL